MGRRDETARLLRWYPISWRQRYGDELVAMMKDSLGGQQPTPRLRIEIALAGLRERGHQAGLLGRASSPADGARAGSLLVLCAWTAFVLAGASFSKLSEHFESAVPGHARGLSSALFTAVQATAVTGAALVITGALVALPAFLRFLGNGGWSAIRRPVARAAATTVVTLAATASLAAWARSLSPLARNGGNWAYGLAFLAWAILVATTLVLWTGAVVAVARRLELAPRVVAVEAAMATALGTAMAAMTALVAAWWAIIATHAPWFLHGSAVGTAGSPFEPQLAATTALMLAAVISAGYGVTRIKASWGELRAR